MKRLTITRYDWLMNVVAAEDEAIRRRNAMAPYTLSDPDAPSDAHYGARYIDAQNTLAEVYKRQNERDAMD